MDARMPKIRVDRMRIYNRSPLVVQNALTSLEGLRLRRQRYGAAYRAQLDLLARRDYSDRGALLELQNQLLCDFVRHASINSAFYREFYAGVDIGAIRGVEDLALLPKLEKETVRQSIAQMRTIARKGAIESSTSGTTGKSITFYYTPEDLQRRLAYLDRWKAEHGFRNLSERRASFNSSKIVPPSQRGNIFWRDNLPCRQRIYSGYHTSGGNLAYIVEDLLDYRPVSIDGYPSALFQVANYMNARGITPHSRPVAIFPTAETLLPHYQDAIENAFGCPVLDQYASSEGAPFITMCTAGKRHYCVDSGVIEEDGPEGVLVTGFDTHGTPLIRYRIGDRITLASPDDRCECGSGLPLVSVIEGRGHDYLIAEDGRHVPALYLSLVSNSFANSVVAMQFQQARLGEVVVLLEVDERYDSSMGAIIVEKLRYSFGETVKVVVRIVDRIDRDPSGKFRLLVNNVGC